MTLADRPNPWRVRLIGFTLLAAVLALTLSAGVSAPKFLPAQDKLEHLIAFVGLGLLFGWGVSIHALMCVMALLVGAAFGIEALQEALPFGREGALEDALAGVAGGALGLLAAYMIGWMRRESEQAPLAA